MCGGLVTITRMKLLSHDSMLEIQLIRYFSASATITLHDEFDRLIDLFGASQKYGNKRV